MYFTYSYDWIVNMPKYYILKCRIHEGTIYSITEDDDICGGCARIEEKKNKSVV